MSSSAVATLMTFVLRLSHGKCFKTSPPAPSPSLPKLLLCCWSRACWVAGWQPIGGRLASVCRYRPQCLPGTAGNRLICTGFFPDFPTVRGRQRRHSRKGSPAQEGGSEVAGGGGVAQGRELLIKVLSPRCWQNEQVDKDSSPASLLLLLQL